MGQWKLLNFTDEEKIYATGEVFSNYKWRKKILERDKNKCQICKNFLRDLYTHLQYRNEVHHIYPRRFGGKNTLQNGITLCKLCHSYFDYMMARFGRDYYHIIRKKSRAELLNHIQGKPFKKYLKYLVRR